MRALDYLQYNAALEGHVEYESSTTFVIVSGESYWNAAVFGRSQDDRMFVLSSDLIYEYRSLISEERVLACSRNPRDHRAVATLLASKRLQHEKRQFGNRAEEVDSQLSDHARWLKQFSEPFLQGDFSQWLEISEYGVSKAFGKLKRSGRSEYCLRLAGFDENGKPVHVQEHVLNKSIDYLARLRTEANLSESI